MKKLRDKRGETLIESLVSVLIAALAFAFLATAAVSAEKINAKTRNTDVSFRYTSAEETDPAQKTASATAQVSLEGSGAIPLQDSGTVTLYTYNGYHYYTATSTATSGTEVDAP